MSAGGFQQTTHSVPTTSSTQTSGSSDTIPVPSTSTPGPSLDGQLLVKGGNSPDPSVSQTFVMIPPHSQSQSTNLQQGVASPAEYSTSSFHFPYGNSRQANLFLFTSDGNFAALSPHQLDVKEIEKDSSGVTLSGRPLSNSSMSAGSNSSPKPFMALHINESKNDKMISGFDERIDGLSPLSVIAVSAYQDTGHPSPNLSGSGLSRSQQILRYQPGGDAMLSALNYNESDMLQEGGFDVPSSTAFGTLDGLLGSGISGSGTHGIRLPDLLDGEMTQESYMEASQDLQLSPQPFSASGDAFTVGENTSLSGINESSSVDTAEDTSKSIETSGALLPDKLRTKGRPVKATSPSRPGTQPCPTCGKVFSNSSALTKHKLTHSDERKYVCQLCAKAFKRQDHLNGHMLTHRNKKPFECDAEGCGKSYCDARSLRRHKENHHSNSSSSASSLTVPALGSHVTVIPGLAHLGFNSLQPSFPASVITSSTSTVFTESSLGNRIQYAPPPSGSAHTSTISSDNMTRSVGSPLMGSVIPTAASHLQFLAFHQQPSTKAPLQHSSASNARTDSTILTSWQPQTINTSALLLAQNFGSSQSTQIMTGSFDISQEDQSKTMNAELSRHQPQQQHLQSQDQNQDTEKSQSFLHQDAQEHSSLKRTSSEEYIDSLEPISSTSLSESSTVDKSHTSTNHSVHIVGNSDRVTESVYSRLSALNQPLIKIEINETEESSSVSSMPTTPTTKDPLDCPQLGSPLLQQLLNPQQTMEVLEGSVLTHSEQSFISNSQEQRSSVAVQQSQVLIPQWTQVPYAVPNPTTANHRFSQDPKPVECSLCQRKFKNIPALNGHMRLHGGYFKKENDLKKGDKKPNGTSNHPPLQTASTNVRALIEEKIIQRRNFGPLATHSTLVDNSPSLGQNFDYQNQEQANQETNSQFSAQPSPILSPTAQEASVFTEFPVTSQSSVHYDLISNTSCNSILDEWQRKIVDLKFRVPRPPVEKHRRHSDSDHFIPPKRPCTSFTNSALADLLRRKVVAKRTSRTGSDPGESLHIDSSFPVSNVSTSIPLTLTYTLPKFTTSVPTSISNSLESAAQQISQSDLSSISADEPVLPVLSAEDIPEVQPASEGLRDVSEMQLNVCLLQSATKLPNSTIESHCLDKNVFFDSSTNDISVGHHFPDITVSELEMMQLASVVSSAATVPNSTETMSGIKNRTGEDSNDDDVFLSPTSLPTSPMKIKRKHRPEPLYIPPYVNTCGFTSRLRSPRLWDPSNPEHKKLSPPPYTPPPMLSPVRSGSGLFWHIITGSGSLTPKSAPITPSFGLARKGSTGETTPDEEEEIGEAPETDILPHVNIGSHYQAKLPPFNPNFKDSLLVEHKADKVWDPNTMDFLSDDDVEMYLELACCAAVPGGGRNKEYALHLLHICKGRIQDAILTLMESCPELPSGHPLLTYQYSENDRWNPEEIEAYHQGLIRCDKDFFSIAKEIPAKTVKQCIQFYYLWKKVCPDEYKRIRLIRRRKEQESLFYNLRSKEPSDNNEEKRENHTLSPGDDAEANITEDLAEQESLMNGQIPAQRCLDVTRTTLSGNAANSASNVYNGSSVPSSTSAYEFPLEPPDEFPCKICGKVFNKVKSRSAHMKSHRQIDNDKKNKFEC